MEKDVDGLLQGFAGAYLAALTRGGLSTTVRGCGQAWHSLQHLPAVRMILRLTAAALPIKSGLCQYETQFHVMKQQNREENNHVFE